MPTKQTFVTQLLRIYHERENICDSRLQLPTLRQATYLSDVGLGPIAFRAYGDLLRDADPEIYSMLLSADLTTRVIYRQMENATIELLERLNSVDVSPTLMKGISTSYEFYSPSYLRLMGDVDILVRDFEVEITMAKLSDLGYVVSDEDWISYREKGHHHLPAARNPKTGITVEVHTDLFAPVGPFAKQPVFRADSIKAQTIEFDYNETRAKRFTPEFQFVYTIAHWTMDGNWAVNLTSINDTIHILRKHGSEFDWSLLAKWIADNPWIYPSVAVLIKYLSDANIVANLPQLREALLNSKLELEPGTLKILVWLLHNYPFNAYERTRDGYAIWRAQEIWQEVSRANYRDIKIPYSFLRIALRSAHHGKYNPLGLLLALFRYLNSRLRTD